MPIYAGRQLDYAREAGRVAAEILRLTCAEVKAGVSTAAVDAAAAQFMAERSCKSAFLNYHGFPGNICISVNDEIVHGIGRKNRIIQEGDIVKIDVGIRTHAGWVGDNANTVPVGKIAEETWALLQATEDSLDKAISMVRNNGSLRELCGSIEKLVTARGYSVVRKLVGHGVGRQLHEDPQVPNFADPSIKTKLRAGMIIAIEPMINLGTGNVKTLADQWTECTADGKPSAHFEHMVLVTTGEPEVLTPRPRLTQPGNMVLK
jgi:methionyl aminopeptidase